MKSALSEKLLKCGIWRLKALQRKEAYQSIALGLNVSKFQQPNSYVEHGFRNRTIKQSLKWLIGESGNRRIGESENRGIGEAGNIETTQVVKKFQTPAYSPP